MFKLYGKRRILGQSSPSCHKTFLQIGLYQFPILYTVYADHLILGLIEILNNCSFYHFLLWVQERGVMRLLTVERWSIPSWTIHSGPHPPPVDSKIAYVTPVASTPRLLGLKMSSLSTLAISTETLVANRDRLVKLVGNQSTFIKTNGSGEFRENQANSINQQPGRMQPTIPTESSSSGHPAAMCVVIDFDFLFILANVIVPHGRISSVECRGLKRLGEM